jgi:hypothetical protein
MSGGDRLMLHRIMLWRVIDLHQAVNAGGA